MSAIKSVLTIYLDSSDGLERLPHTQEVVSSILTPGTNREVAINPPFCSAPFFPPDILATAEQVNSYVGLPGVDDGEGLFHIRVSLGV